MRQVCHREERSDAAIHVRPSHGLPRPAASMTDLERKPRRVPNDGLGQYGVPLSKPKGRSFTQLVQAKHQQSNCGHT